MKKLLIGFLSIFFGCHLYAQTISENATISLLTGSPGAELYNTFGHSAIRVNDPDTNIDVVFNYGTFNSHIPYFYYYFVRRKVDYSLSIERFQDFEAGFRYENRSVVEQELNLSFDQKKMLFEALKNNIKPENRYYRYDFFYDNCATRIRDLMIIAFGGNFEYNYPADWEKGEMTFRNLIDLYLTNHHWSDFGIDIALGMPTDAIATPADYMFLPDYLAEGFGSATILQNDVEVPFVMTQRLIIPRKELAPHHFFITPMRLMWSLLVLTALLSAFGAYKNLNLFWFDLTYFSILGILGWVVFLLWFFTDHIATKDNLNILWAVPLYFPLFLFWNKLPDMLKKWAIIVFGSADILILVFWTVFPQSYHTAFIPLILIILLRLSILYRKHFVVFPK